MDINEGFVKNHKTLLQKDPSFHYDQIKFTHIYLIYL